MENRICELMHKPHAVSTGGVAKSAAELEEEWRVRGVRYTPDATLLLDEIVRLHSKEHVGFLIHCFTARGFNYNDNQHRPPLQMLLNRVLQEGYQLFTPEALFQLSLRRTPALLPGKACLVSMASIEDEEGRLHLPLFQTICPGEGEPTTMVRMVTGNPYVDWSLDMPIMFLKQL